MTKLAEYWKGIIAAAVPVIYAVYVASADGFTQDEVIALTVMVLGAIGVILKGNKPPEAAAPPVPPPTLPV